MKTGSSDVSRSLRAIIQRWPIVVGMAVVAGVAAGFWAQSIATPRFEAVAQVTYQAPSRENPTGSWLPSNGVTREDVATLVTNAQANQVTAAAADKAGVSERTMRTSVRIAPAGDAAVIRFEATSSNARQAAEMANAWATTFVTERQRGALGSIDAQIKQLRDDISQFGRLKFDDPANQSKALLTQKLSDLRTQRAQWADALRVSDKATVPDEPVWPRPMLAIFSAVIAGLAIGAGIALLLAGLDRKLRPAHLAGLPAPVVVNVPLSARATKSVPLAPGAAEPLVADAYAALGTRLLLDRSGDGAHVVLVTSPRPGDGKSSVAAGLASALAMGGRKVVLVDADMRRPSQDIIFPSLQGRPGLSQVLAGSVTVEQALNLAGSNLAAMPAGPPASNASVLLASVGFRQLVERLAGISEVVVIDAPPALAVTDPLAIAPAADQVLVCGRLGGSNLGELEDTCARLTAASSTPVAIVIVGSERPNAYGYELASTSVAAPLTYPVDSAAGASRSPGLQTAVDPMGEGPYSRLHESNAPPANGDSDGLSVRGGITANIPPSEPGRPPTP